MSTGPSELRFPQGFLWGVSTAAHQVEGGLTDNNWADFERQDRIRTGEKAGLACDWWNHAERDFDHAQTMGLNALRLSVEWSRVEPAEGRFDDGALMRYRGMIDGLKARGIRPFVSLHHFTDPMWLVRRGGWTDEGTPALFERFTRRVVDALGDLCTDWVTFNEPNVYASMGYVLGEFPPGRRGDLLGSAKVIIHMLRAHAAAYRVLHQAQSDANVGFTVNLQQFSPENAGSFADRAMTAFLESSFNQSFLRGLDDSGLNPLRAAWRMMGDAAGEYDYVGFNHYGWMHVAFDRSKAKDGFLRLEAPRNMKVGDPALGGAHYGGFDPHGLAVIAEKLSRLKKPIYVLEHGIPDRDDRLRPWLIARGATELHGAIQKGVDVRGYFHWTLVDNFEWAQGWGLRFGLIGLDPKTQERTWRPSAKLFQSIARHNALREEDVRRYAPDALPLVPSPPRAADLSTPRV